MWILLILIKFCLLNSSSSSSDYNRRIEFMYGEIISSDELSLDFFLTWEKSKGLKNGFLQTSFKILFIVQHSIYWKNKILRFPTKCVLFSSTNIRESKNKVKRNWKASHERSYMHCEGSQKESECAWAANERWKNATRQNWKYYFRYKKCTIKKEQSTGYK